MKDDNLAAPRIEVSMPKTFLEVLIKDQGPTFAIKLQKAALNHAVVNGCKDIVPTEDEIQTIVGNFLRKELEDKMVNYEASPIHLRKGRFVLTSPAKKALQAELDKYWSNDLRGYINKQLATLNSLVDRTIETARKRAETRLEQMESQIQGFEEQMSIVHSE